MENIQAADAFRLTVEASNVVIDFGSLDPHRSTGDRTSVAVTDRVKFPLHIAERLLVSLGESLRGHEAALRAAAAKGKAPEDAAADVRPGAPSPRPATDQSGERAAQLLRLVGDWGVPHLYERSFRISDVGVQANRFLLTLNTRDIPDRHLERVLDVCDRMGIPPAMRTAAVEHFESASCIHFGFEGDPGSIVCKLYLERSVPPEETRRAIEARESVPLHLAFKWDLLGPSAVTSKYSWYPGLSLAGIEERMSQVYRDGPEGSLEIARAVARLATEREAPERLQYLEVEEPGNARRSFDLNVYNAKLFVRDIQPMLQRMRERFSVRPGQFQALYDQIKGMPLGHLAGGVHRNGRDFFNVYYGVVTLPRFNKALGQP